MERINLTLGQVHATILPRGAKVKKKQKLKGFYQAGMIFIGDPSYMSGNTSTLPGDENPFRQWEEFADSVGSDDCNLPFIGGFSDDAYGRGVIVQTTAPAGQYEVKKSFDKDGKLKEIKITIKD